MTGFLQPAEMKARQQRLQRRALFAVLAFTAAVSLFVVYQNWTDSRMWNNAAAYRAWLDRAHERGKQ